jgi:transposase, IS30 family
MVSGADREEISRGIAEGVEGVVIAARIGRNPSVVSREIARHGGRERYRATRAARVAARARCRPKARKLDADPVLRAQVIARLRAGHSPDQVAGRLRHEHSGQHAERVADTVSHEAIYTWIYALPKGELARQGILLRSGRTRRRPRARRSSPGARIVGMTSIDARPAEASDRAVPGAWEGDLVIGKAGRSAMATLVERTSRYTVPVALPAGRRDALTTCDALIAAVSGMPSQLVKTLTWDQGSEMAGHAAFSLATAVDVYFAHPHSPWERGTNENTNGLLREYFPKGTEITDDQAYLDLVARELNNRPRRILGYRTPAEVFTDLLASSIASTGWDRPLLDHEFAPAVELAEAYAQRWEIELSFDEIEIHQTGGERVLRSRTPELVKQEIWSLLLVHYAIRHVMKDAADTVGTDPDDLSFMRSYRAIRRQVPNQAGFSPW